MSLLTANYEHGKNEIDLWYEHHMIFNPNKNKYWTIIATWAIIMIEHTANFEFEWARWNSTILRISSASDHLAFAMLFSVRVSLFQFLLDDETHINNPSAMSAMNNGKRSIIKSATVVQIIAMIIHCYSLQMHSWKPLEFGSECFLRQNDKLHTVEFSIVSRKK